MQRKSLAIVDYAALAAESGLKVVPLTPVGKIPWVQNWTEAASTDVDQVYAWFQQKPQSNYGICTGYDGLFVIDLDGPEAIAWWREQGFQPGVEVMTPNGGMHVYYRAPEGFEVQTNQKKLHHKVDVRGVGGQAAGPGSVLGTGTYRGDVEAIAEAPEAPPELMAIIPEKQSYTQVAPTREEKVEEAHERERAGVAYIIQKLQSLPSVWASGAGWHDTVRDQAMWLSRMVNSNDYAMTEDAALTILLTHTPTYPSWGEDKVILYWEDAKKRTIGQFAPPPGEEDDIPGLLPLFKAQEGVPTTDSRGRDFMDLVWTPPASDTDGAFWDRRRQIMLESLRAGLDIQQAFSLTAGSVAAEMLMREHDGRLTLWKEAKKHIRDFQNEQVTGLPTQEPDTLDVPVELGDVDRLELLTRLEREAMFADPDKYRWIGTRYLEWVRDSVKLANMPYHRLHVWMNLSVVFGMLAYIPREGKKLGVNLWGFIIGDSSTGKTEALEKAESVIDAYFKDDDVNLGADATTEALHDALIGRDGKPSYQVIDEAHGLLGDLSGSKGFRGDLITRWTEFYEGKVRASLRSTKKEISGKAATTSFSLLMQGTSEKMRKAMNTSLWESGFLVRALFVIGENIEPSEEDLDVRLIEGDADAAYNAMPRQFAAEWQNTRRRLQGRYGDDPIKMEFEADALARLNAAMRRMRADLKTRPNQVALKPYAARFPNQVLKMAALVALSEARVTVSERDVLIALHASEEFLTAAIIMAKLTTDTDFAQKVDAVEKLVAERGGKLELNKVYRHFSEPVFEVNKWIDQLVAERRVTKTRPITGDFTINLIRDTERMAA
ncbi:bifunctional DNA primase/polymerase [Leifsonia aquatica]|uniref:bifunctional DNA primase/polymerase n=1 Tax=Leifsonia aquatica TaxID=144185 RepID=UPI00046A76BB|nr:bifunctional DNA primase/polymerase [Leifsonia aquatica]